MQQKKKLPSVAVFIFKSNTLFPLFADNVMLHGLQCAISLYCQEIIRFHLKLPEKS